MNIKWNLILTTVLVLIKVLATKFTIVGMGESTVGAGGFPF